MAKWEIPDNRERKQKERLIEALKAYVETDETPIDDQSEYGQIKRDAIQALKEAKAYP